MGVSGVVGVLVVLGGLVVGGVFLGLGFVGVRGVRGVRFWRLGLAGKSGVDVEAARIAVASVYPALGRGESLWLVRHWDGRSMGVYLGATRGVGDQIVGQLATSLGADIVAVEGGVSLGGLGRVAHLVGVRWMDMVVDLASIRRGDPTAILSQLLVSQDGPACLVVALRPLAGYQGVRHRRLLQQRGVHNPQWVGTNGHHHLQSTALFRMSMWAATGPSGDPRGIVEAALGPSIMPGFSYRAKALLVKDRGLVVLGVLGVVLVGLGVYLGVGVGVLVVGGIGGVGVPLGMWVSGGSVMRRRRLGQIRGGSPPQGRDLWGVNGRERTWEVGGDGAKKVPRNHIARWLIVSPVEVAVMLMPPSELDVTAGGARGARRPAPAGVLQPGGVPLGRDVRDQWVFLQDGLRREGVFVTGDPGQGKTVCVLGLWGYDLAKRQAEMRDGGGARSAHIWFEEKGEGAARAYQRALLAGVPESDILMLDVTSLEGPRLELADTKDIEKSARELVEAMVYSFPPGSIMGRAKDILQRNWELVLAVPPQMANRFRDHVLPTRLDLLLLALGEGDKKVQDKFIKLLEQYASESPEEVSEDGFLDMSGGSGGGALRRALDRYYFYANAASVRDREEMMRPAIGRVSDMRATSAMWQDRPDRPAVSFVDLLEQKRVVIINFGGGQITPGATKQISAMAMYILRATIERVCEGWEARGWGVYIYCDELSNICGADTGGGDELDVIANLKDIGRSRGVKLNLATQRMDQLSDRTRSVLSTMGTKLYLRTESISMAAAAVEDLVGREISGPSTVSRFTPEDIRNLSQMEGLLRVRVNDIAQPPFNLYLPPETEFHPDFAALSSPPPVNGALPGGNGGTGKLTVPGLDYGSNG